VYPPEAFAVVVATDVPVSETVAPTPPAPLIVPEIENVCDETAVEAKLTPVTFAAVIVVFCAPGLNVNPV
jgi:hypothetical protein